MNLELRPCERFDGGGPQSVAAPYWVHLAKISHDARLLHLFLTMHLRDGWNTAEGWALMKLIQAGEDRLRACVEELVELGALTRAPDGVLTVEQEPPDGYTGPLVPEELKVALTNEEAK